MIRIRSYKNLTRRFVNSNGDQAIVNRRFCNSVLQVRQLFIIARDDFDSE
jgi:hypothetical protein